MLRLRQSEFILFPETRNRNFYFSLGNNNDSKREEEGWKSILEDITSL